MLRVVLCPMSFRDIPKLSRDRDHFIVSYRFFDNGIHIRKINQAYFAFYGTYADGPASSNPVGPKIERVWELTIDLESLPSQLLAEARDDGGEHPRRAHHRQQRREHQG